MIAQMGDIFFEVLAPVLVMASLGAVVQRVRPLDVDTLVKLNLYVFVPVFLFVRIHESTLEWGQIGKIGLTVLIPMALLGAAIYPAMRKAKAAGTAIAAVVVGGLFFNAGNFGLAVSELAFGERGGEVQSLVVMFMNTTIFFVGYGILALAQGRGGWAVMGYFKLPMIYVIVAALAMREYDLRPLPWVSDALHTIAKGMVPVALVTLGAQLALRARWPNWKLITPVLFLKLAAMPAVTALVVVLLPGMWPWPGAQLILAAAGPTAVNTLLLTLELDGDADTAADCVFWTTVCSAASVTVVLSIILYAGGGPV